ncbi:hypothetical protein GF356_00265, partial [candidate division GN15 bacterium]|nr:hypothetical protein [candidate division GN15 bacterium]
KYGYDRAGNRTYREQTCDPNSHHDEVYGYDGINRLTDFDRGTINANKDAISTLKFAQQWSLDPTGNWSGFKEDDDGDSTWDLEQSRTSNEVNEITDISETAGPAWATPAYNRAGNMTTIPKPADPTTSFAATYDAWNRLVKLEDSENTVSEYVYDAAKRRIVKKTYSGGSLDTTRHFYYTDPERWQVIEERIESSGVISAEPDRQFIWGLRYIDNLVLRDRDTDSNGSLNERLYALQDVNWNVTAVADSSGSMQERYGYTAYGTPRFLTPTFTTRASSSYGAEVLYAGYRYDGESSFFHVRNRLQHPALGCWMQRDPIGYRAGALHLALYVHCRPLVFVDASGKQTAKPKEQFPPIGPEGPWWFKWLPGEKEDLKGLTCFRSKKPKDAFDKLVSSGVVGGFVKCVDGKFKGYYVGPEAVSNPAMKAKFAQNIKCGLHACTAMHEEHHILQYTEFCPNACKTEHERGSCDVIGMGPPELRKKAECYGNKIGALCAINMARSFLAQGNAECLMTAIGYLGGQDSNMLFYGCREDQEYDNKVAQLLEDAAALIDDPTSYYNGSQPYWPSPAPVPEQPGDPNS